MKGGLYENRQEKALKNVLTSMVDGVFVLLKGKNLGSGETELKHVPTRYVHFLQSRMLMQVPAHNQTLSIYSWNLKIYFKVIFAVAMAWHPRILKCVENSLKHRMCILPWNVQVKTLSMCTCLQPGQFQCPKTVLLFGKERGVKFNELVRRKKREKNRKKGKDARECARVCV